MRGFGTVLVLCAFLLVSRAENNNEIRENDLVIKLNSAIDNVLYLAKMAFIHDGELSIPLPDQKKEIGKAPYSGFFIATSGYFKNLASLHRTGDIEVVKKGSSIGLMVALGLSEVDAGYQKYKFDILGTHQEGKIDVSIANNSLVMSINLTYLPSCKLNLDYVKFDELSGIKVNITGLGVFQTLFEQLSTWIINNFEGNIKTMVNKKLYQKLDKLLKKEDFCKYFPL